MRAKLQVETLCRAVVALALHGTIVGASANVDESKRNAVAESRAGIAHETQEVTQQSRPREDGRRTLRRFVPNLGRAALGVFSLDNLRPLIVGGAATGIGAVFDDDVADWIADPDHGVGRGLEDGAAPPLIGAAVAGVFVVGRFAEGPKLRAVTYDLLDAFLVNWGYTGLIKVAVRRERPNGEDDRSFPSGHASNAFALAAVAESHYGWKVGIPAYSLASLVAISRTQRNKHYLSDVLAGATLGYIVGRTVVRVNDAPLAGTDGATIQVSPLIGLRTQGVMVSIVF